MNTFSHKRVRVTAVLLLGMLTFTGLAYLIFGWGLKPSDSTASYGAVRFWTEAGGNSFEEPFAITVDARNGNVIVTDSKAQRVVVLDGDGNFIRSIGSPGDGPGELENPTGVAVGPDGSIYIADYDLDRVQKFSESGDFLLSWGTSGTGDREFDSPNGIAVDTRGQVYVADFYNKVVKVFDSEGTFLRTIGKPGQWGRGALDYPTDVDVMKDGTVLVADAYNYRIQTFTSAGLPVSQWGWHLFWLYPRPSDGHQGFAVPSSVAWDSANGLIHIADSANRRVVMLDEHGAYISEWKIEEEGNGYDTPIGIAVSADGETVYATDIDNGRIAVLEVKKI